MKQSLPRFLYKKDNKKVFRTREYVTIDRDNDKRYPRKVKKNFKKSIVIYRNGKTYLPHF